MPALADLSLRTWLEQVRGLGELREVHGADAELEIGTIVDILMERAGNPAVLFDAIPGFRPDYRVLGNVLTSPARLALSSGLDPAISKLDLVKAWREINSSSAVEPHQVVQDGPVKECLETGSQVDLCQFPAPRWHEEDGGEYIGTGCLVIQKDPDTGWINCGTYRIQRHDGRTLGLMITQGKHGGAIMRKYWEREEACPVAISFGHHPLFLMVGGMAIPEGMCEYDYIGGLLGQPLQTVAGEITGLPVPAEAELVIEGEIPPDERRSEGPFGEWTGYYASGEGPQPVVHVESVMHRQDPINLGVLPGKPPNDNTYGRNFLGSALLWAQLEKAGMPGIQGVWLHESGGGRLMITVSITQQYPGHSKQTGLVAASCRAGSYLNHLTVVVDDDIDPTNSDEVIWAMCSRVDPREDVEILKRMWASPLDPMAYPPESRGFNSRMVIDACRPWERLNSFPKVARASAELRQEVREKFAEFFA
ncbi:MAG TPA: UbiD family decarboxylase [Chloroflexota bacterium]